MRRQPLTSYIRRMLKKADLRFSPSTERAPVESRTGAGASRAPVLFPIPARQTGRANFPHPAFRLASCAGSRTRPHGSLEPYNAQGAEHPFLGELAGTLRRYLVTP